MCVRICDEVMDNSALGLTGRGFDTKVEPAFSRDFKNTKCISCGQCVGVCPTGALQEKLQIEKSVPLKGKKGLKQSVVIVMLAVVLSWNHRGICC